VTMTEDELSEALTQYAAGRKRLVLPMSRIRDVAGAIVAIAEGHHAPVRMPDMPPRELAPAPPVLPVPLDAGPALYGLGSCSCRCYACSRADHQTP
jgi:hypothetical protein